MKKMMCYLQMAVLLVCIGFSANAQEKLSIENVRQSYLRNSGTIMENNDVKGYYSFYLSDKIDKHTNQYTLQILDENLNKVKDIVFEDNKNVEILESAYNGSSIMFLFYDSKEKTLEYRAYGFDGKQKSSYVKELNKRSKALIEDTYGQKSEDGQNEALFDIEGKGYVTIYPVKEGKYYSYEINYFFTDRKKQWTFEAAEEQEDKWSAAVYLGSTDSLVIFEVIKQKTLLGGKPHSWLLALNMYSGKKEFEVSTESEEDYKFYPMNISPIAGKSEFLLMGSYYEKDSKIMKDKTLGLASWTVDPKGKVLAKKYNSWDTDIAKYLPVNKSGTVGDLGFIYFHKVIQTADGNFFAIGEGYKKVVSAGGAVLKGLSMLGGSTGGGSMFKIRVTDLVVMKFNSSFEIKGANIYDKFNNNFQLPAGAGYMSPHTLALMVKAFDAFDYDYTKLNNSTGGFITAYTDYEKSGEDKGSHTFNTISYAGGDKLTTDKLVLTSKAKSVRVFPAKAGSVMVLEYYKKDKRLDFHLEKMN